MKYISATHDMSSLTAEYIAEDGTRYLRSGGTLSWRFFNPGNIRPSKTSPCDPLKIGVGKTKNGRFMIFPDYQTGWNALKILLVVTYKDFTVGQIAAVYSPESDGNDPERYTRFIINKSGVGADEYIKDLDDSSLEKLMEAIKQIEGYYHKKETRKETLVPATTITITDGHKPLADEKVKVVIDQCTYEWKTNRYGQIPAIAHIPGRKQINLIAADPWGKESVIYTAIAGTESKNILLLKQFQTYTAKTGTHKEGEKAAAFYTVKKGDTLGKIARAIKTTVKRLADLNGIENANRITVGQKLKIPDGISKPLVKPSGAESTQPVETGSSDKGYPQANIGNSAEQAPWMKIVIREGKQWHGTGEKEIADNYHALLNQAGTLANTAWCASFANYCLKESGYPYSKKYTRASQFPAYDTVNFVEIKRPVYGALMVFRTYVTSNNKFTGNGHVTFVYGISSSGDIIGIGGNQGGTAFGGGTIKASQYSTTSPVARFKMTVNKVKGVAVYQKFYKFYVPATYKDYADSDEDLITVEVDKVNKEVLEIGKVSTQKDEGGGL
ncbi:TIGR02594 family protein [Intestinirhabdus alba]|jgi:uncharacterized protein (TIGR02594 family)|uniref:TIGR02594 family protein n=1 Tax=Intestinirhabdus alba TaxID=2899544 RepID=A0A6L6IS50_9ENTR|nr:TIGR02594 family protein [Intestinirhabdus alba]MTH48216.1 TIGR02594 family protein [Intestinirhabdus alba]